jgi:hypothetical protein
MKFKKDTGKLSAEMTDKDRQNIYEAVTDYLGAITSNHLIRQEEQRKAEEKALKQKQKMAKGK